jgi:hypothetical protein
MRVIIGVLFGILLFNTSATFAYVPQEGNITVTLGPFANKTDFKGSDSGAETAYLGGFGLIVVGDINDHSSLELSAFYTNKDFVRDEDAKFVVQKTQVLQINMGYRWWLSHYLSTSLAFYSAYSNGIPEIVHSDFPKGQEITTSAEDTTEYGLDLSAQAEIWSSGRYALVLDGRYSLSLTAKENEYANDFGFLVGIRYYLQGKRPMRGQPKETDKAVR